MLGDFFDVKRRQKSGRKITVYFNGGLGNQLFQLAGGLAIVQNLHREVAFSETQISRNILTSPRLFAVGELLEVGELNEKFKNFPAENLFGKFFHKDLNIYENGPNDNVLTKICPNTQKVFAFFQDISIVSSVKEQLLKRISRSQIFADCLLSERIGEIGIHVRLGDYRTSQIAKNFHGLTDNSYFIEGAKLLRSKLGVSVVTLFSDEPHLLCKIEEDLTCVGFQVKRHTSITDIADLIQLSKYAD